MLIQAFYFAVFLSSIVLSLLFGGGLGIFSDARAWIAIAFGIAWAWVEVSLGPNQFAKRWVDRAWVAAGLVGMMSGFTSAVYQSGHTRVGVWTDAWVVVAGLVVGGAGLAIRFAAIHTLGKFFNHELKVTADHRIIQTGLYRHLRHPSYTGLGLICLGVVLMFGSMIVFGMMFIAMHIAFTVRIFVEEQILLDHFGDDYRLYQQRTKRLIPFVW